MQASDAPSPTDCWPVADVLSLSVVADVRVQADAGVASMVR
jgi:hypothetical protein